MARSKGRQSAKSVEQFFPHFVEIAVPPNGLGNALIAMYDFHAKHGIEAKRDHGRHDDGASYIRWCFADPALADAFAKEYDHKNARSLNVRLTPKSGRSQSPGHVRFGPITDIRYRSLDYLVGPEENRLRDGNIERVCRFRIYDQLKLRRPLNRRRGRFGTFENAVNVVSEPIVRFLRGAVRKYKERHSARILPTRILRVPGGSSRTQ